ncbi:Imm10 family immunity protein [Xanthomonas sacchari]|uniref:Imm10 family immunity protein n=1 Tax=Xanthomonas sacchari TaxID=56458 RepID=UPI00225DD48E|nr:Imm10 family immunity protein [Xanthomonas sacchari]
MYKFIAKTVSVKEDEYCIVIGLADHEVEPSRYLILQNAKTYDQQDRSLGMDHAHLEIGGGLESCYGGLKKVSFDGGILELLLSVDAQKKLGIDEGIEILMAKQEEYEQLEKALNQICVAEKIPFFLNRSSDK